MRLVCPNCGAQYEVADDTIPEAGRDVQCSNCGHTWYEHPGSSEPAEIGAPVAAAVEPEPEVEVEVEPEPQPAPEPQPEPTRQPLDSEVANILRQEAAHEEAARRAEAPSLETQPDLGLDTRVSLDEQRSNEAQHRLARLRGEDNNTAGPAAAAAAAAATVAASAPNRATDQEASRRELLPDIEEINSTLRSEADPAVMMAQPEQVAAKKSGFRRGFFLIVVLAVVAALIYIFAPQISAALPQLADPLTAYTDWVDGARLWLDLKVQGLTAQMTGDEAAIIPEAPPINEAPVITPEAPTAPAAPAANEG